MMLFKGGCTHLRCMFGDNQRPLAIDQKLSAEIVLNKFTLVSDRAFKLIGKLIGMEEWHDAFIFTSLGVSAAFKYPLNTEHGSSLPSPKHPSPD